MLITGTGSMPRHATLGQPTKRKEVEGMAKKKKTRVPKTGPVWKQTAEEATLAKMPRYTA